jgi:hypothetical protein
MQPVPDMYARLYAAPTSSSAATQSLMPCAGLVSSHRVNLSTTTSSSQSAAPRLPLSASPIFSSVEQPFGPAATLAEQTANSDAVIKNARAASPHLTDAATVHTSASAYSSCSRLPQQHAVVSGQTCVPSQSATSGLPYPVAS